MSPCGARTLPSAQNGLQLREPVVDVAGSKELSCWRKCLDVRGNDRPSLPRGSSISHGLLRWERAGRELQRRAGRLSSRRQSSRRKHGRARHVERMGPTAKTVAAPLDWCFATDSSPALSAPKSAPDRSWATFAQSSPRTRCFHGRIGDTFGKRVPPPLDRHLPANEIICIEKWNNSERSETLSGCSTSATRSMLTP